MKKLYRSRTDYKLFGLCGGLAEYLNVDPTLLRVILVITTIFSGFTMIPIYLIAALVVPKEPLFGSPSDFTTYTHSGGGSGFGTHGGYYTGGANPKGTPQQPAESGIDEMMKDIEKKALHKEIEELKAKLAKYEKGDK